MRNVATLYRPTEVSVSKLKDYRLFLGISVLLIELSLLLKRRLRWRTEMLIAVSCSIVRDKHCYTFFVCPVSMMDISRIIALVNSRDGRSDNTSIVQSHNNATSIWLIFQVFYILLDTCFLTNL